MPNPASVSIVRSSVHVRRDRDREGERWCGALAASGLGEQQFEAQDAAGSVFVVPDHRFLFRFTSEGSEDDPDHATNCFADETLELIARAGRASASFPGAFEPVLETPNMLARPPRQLPRWDGSPPSWLVDGGVLDTPRWVASDHDASASIRSRHPTGKSRRGPRTPQAPRRARPSVLWRRRNRSAAANRMRHHPRPVGRDSDLRSGGCNLHLEDAPCQVRRGLQHGSDQLGVMVAVVRIVVRTVAL